MSVWKEEAKNLEGDWAKHLSVRFVTASLASSRLPVDTKCDMSRC